MRDVRWLSPPPLAPETTPDPSPSMEMGEGVSGGCPREPAEEAEEDRDPWLDEPWTAEEEAAFAAVSEDDEEW